MIKPILSALSIVIIFGCASSRNVSRKATTTASASQNAAVANKKGFELMSANDCTACHTIDKKTIGPSYIDIAKKYEPPDSVIDMLVGTIINGGSGVWGQVPMTPHPTLSKDTAREMVKYILSLKNQ